MEDIPGTLAAIAKLLRMYQIEDWAIAMDNFAGRHPTEAEEVQAAILSIYGGMGSFSDIVLQDSYGAMPRADNDELERLRRHLYRACAGST